MAEEAAGRLPASGKCLRPSNRGWPDVRHLRQGRSPDDSKELMESRNTALDERTPDRAHSLRGRRRSVDVKVLLLLLPLLAALPLLAYGGFLLWVTAEQAAAHARRELGAAHGTLQAALAGELQHKEQLLTLLAESPELNEGALDVARAASLAHRVVHAGSGIHVIAIRDRTGAVIGEYPARAGAPRTVKLTPHQVQVFETGKAAVSDVHESFVDGRSSVSMDVPVRRGGRVPWIITALLDPVQLSRTLAAQVGERDALATVLDSHRRIVARTRDVQRWFGELPSADTLRAVDSGDRGWRRLRTRDGNEYLWTWSTTAAAWTVWLGSPAREFDDALRRSMLRLATAGFGVLLLTMAGTALLARRIAATVGRMAENAHRLAEGERPLYRPSGIRQLDALYQALEDANEKVSRALADRDRALDAERAARAVADEHNRSKDEFLGMLSHELRNPLAPIRNSTYVLQHADPASDQARRARIVIERQTEHLTRIVDDLLDLTRIARGKILLRRDRVDLRELVRRAADDAHLGIERRGVRLRVELPPDALWADADATRVTQILGNLLNNAAKFTPAGGEIDVTLRDVDGTAELRVRDTGAGIDPALLPTIFDPFTQGERTLARSEGGLGLGLALARRLAALHGGDVRAHSEGVGHGAELVVTLPLLGPPVDEEAPRAQPARVPSSRHVLVVDDNADAAESLAELVGLLGHDVTVAYDGPSALAKARERRPDVVLCDIGLPGMTGYDFARAFRAAHDGAVKLVAVSGYAQPEDVRKAVEAGFDVHVAKPPDPAHIERLFA
jgi:signal transduction histidine kinase/CheY-like chemotaxis protein